MSLEHIYQTILMDHYQNPRNAGTISNATCSLHEHNPLCGDEITISMKLEGDRISKVAFDGKGCAISIASASMMTEQLQGKSVNDAKQLIDTFLSIMRGEKEFADHPEFEDAMALEGVKKLHARIKCATLSWNTAKKLLSES
ncbi:MAG: SUF system NifU family Fe-S cluster assembly protein [bacterium]|nr:SUF system NifU family Fe-S cluster assembly protein [bacterium]